MEIDFKLEQPKKVPCSIIEIDSGSVTDVRLVQFPKASTPMLVTVLGIVIDVMALHLLKAN